MRHRQIKVRFTKDYRWFDFFMLVNKNITSLRVEHPVFGTPCVLINGEDTSEGAECIILVEGWGIYHA